MNAMNSLIPAMVILFGFASGQSNYYSRDPVGNVQVSYTASDGHYLMEDRSADATSVLGNYGYTARDGESVGFAYSGGSAGFVISSDPSVRSSNYLPTVQSSSPLTQRRPAALPAPVAYRPPAPPAVQPIVSRSFYPTRNAPLPPPSQQYETSLYNLAYNTHS